MKVYKGKTVSDEEYLKLMEVDRAEASVESDILKKKPIAMDDNTADSQGHPQAPLNMEKPVTLANQHNDPEHKQSDKPIDARQYVPITIPTHDKVVKTPADLGNKLANPLTDDQMSNLNVTDDKSGISDTMRDIQANEELSKRGAQIVPVAPAPTDIRQDMPISEKMLMIRDSLRNKGLDSQQLVNALSEIEAIIRL